MCRIIFTLNCIFVFVIFRLGMEITCEICGASLSTNKSLQRHVPAQHQDLKHLCQVCYKAFKCNKKVKKKNIRMCIPNIWVLPTPVKNVKSLSNIPGSQNTFSNMWYINKIFSCSHCPKEFSTAWGLISH